MYLNSVRKFKLKTYSRKKLLISSAIISCILNPSFAISQSNINSNYNESNQDQSESFVTKAVKKTGPSVVTIDTQKYVKKRKFTRDSVLFLDPSFERFFGLYPKKLKPSFFARFAIVLLSVDKKISLMKLLFFAASDV